MKLTKRNYDIVPESEQSLLLTLLIDLEENAVLPRELEIHWQDWHNEYSPERTDPCPDFYGTYGLKWQGSDDYINHELTIDELDNHICTVCLAFEQLEELYDRESGKC